MSTSSSSFTNPQANPNPTSTTAGIIGTYLLPALTLIGIFVLIALNKVASDVALPIIVAITGVHVGATVTNNAKGG